MAISLSFCGVGEDGGRFFSEQGYPRSLERWQELGLRMWLFLMVVFILCLPSLFSFILAVQERVYYLGLNFYYWTR